MATISHLIRNAQNIDIREFVKNTMHTTQMQLVTEQQQQLLEGKRSDGQRIGKYGSGPRYRRLKFNLNPLAGYGNIDLRLKGGFYRGIKTYFFTTAFFFKSTDWKNDILTKEYGEEIFGLNTKHIKIYAKETLTPLGRERIRKLILQ